MKPGAHDEGAGKILLNGEQSDFEGSIKLP